MHCTQTFEKMSYVTAHVRAEIGVSGHSLKLVGAHFLSSDQNYPKSINIIPQCFFLLFG